MGQLCQDDRGKPRGSLTNQCRGRSYWAEPNWDRAQQGRRGVVAAHVPARKSKTAPEIRGRKSTGNIMAGQRLQMPRKLLVPAVLATGTAISATHTSGDGPPPSAIHKQL